MEWNSSGQLCLRRGWQDGQNTAQLPAASSMPADRRAQVLRPLEIVAAVCDEPALEVLVISAPRSRLGVLDDRSSPEVPARRKIPVRVLRE